MCDAASALGRLQDDSGNNSLAFTKPAPLGAGRSYFRNIDRPGLTLRLPVHIVAYRRDTQPTLVCLLIVASARVCQAHHDQSIASKIMMSQIVTGWQMV